MLYEVITIPREPLGYVAKSLDRYAFAGHLFDDAASDAIALVGGLADALDAEPIGLQPAGMAQCQQLAHPLQYGGIGGDGFQAAEVAAMAAPPHRFDLDMPDLAHVAVLAEKHLAVADDTGAGAVVDADEDRILAIPGGTEQVLGQRVGASVVADVDRQFQRLSRITSYNVCYTKLLRVHGVGLSIGGEGPLDASHLQALRGLLDRYQPDAFSEHLA